MGLFLFWLGPGSPSRARANKLILLSTFGRNAEYDKMTSEKNQHIAPATDFTPPRPSSAPPRIVVPTPPPNIDGPPGTNNEADPVGTNDFAAQLRQVRIEKHRARQQWLKDHPEELPAPETELTKIKTALQIVQAQRKADEAKARAIAEAREEYLREHGEEVAADYEQQLREWREAQKKAYWARPDAHYARHPSEPQELYPGYRSKLRRRLKAEQDKYREIQRRAREKLEAYEAAKAEIDEANARAFEEGRRRREERHLRTLTSKRDRQDTEALAKIAEERKAFITKTALQEYCDMCKREEQARIDRIADVIREAKEEWRKEAIQAAHLAFDLAAALEDFKEERQRKYEERARQGDERSRWMSLRSEDFVFERMAGRATPEAQSSDEEIAAPASWGRKASPGAMPRGRKLHVWVGKETAAPPPSRGNSPTLSSRRHILEVLHQGDPKRRSEPAAETDREESLIQISPVREDPAPTEPQLEADAPEPRPSFQQRPPPPATSRSRGDRENEERMVNKATSAPANEARATPPPVTGEPQAPRPVPKIAARLGFGPRLTTQPSTLASAASNHPAAGVDREALHVPPRSSNEEVAAGRDPPEQDQGERPPQCRPGQSITDHMREKQAWRMTVRYDGTKYVKRDQPLPRRGRRRKLGLQSPAKADNTDGSAK